MALRINSSDNSLILFTMFLGIAAISAAIISNIENDVPEITLYKENDNLLAPDGIPSEAILSEDVSGIHMGGIPGKPDKYIGKPLKEDGHVLAIGESGSGKTGGLVNPTMQLVTGSMVCLDTKDELYHEYMRVHRENPGKECLCFNPCDPEKSNCWYDPFAPMRNNPEHQTEYAYYLAQTLIPEKENDNNAIWTETAISYLTGALRIEST